MAQIPVVRSRLPDAGRGEIPSCTVSSTCSRERCP